MFSVIRSLVSATARSHRDVEAYRDALLGRISAFAATQVELAGHAWSSLGLRELLEFELTPYSEGGGNVSLDGEQLDLDSAAAENLAMVIHELATNAAKHGALSQPDGRLEVTWRLTHDATGEARLVLEWIERGGPPVTPPQRRGFGSMVIERSARSLDGVATLDFAPEGLRCVVDVPAARALAVIRIKNEGPQAA
jgi:two-component sensor histidine kinase